jgi:hypothetical protein
MCPSLIKTVAYLVTIRIVLRDGFGFNWASDFQEKDMALESFFLMGANPQVEDSPTWELHQLIGWEAVSRKLKGLYHREKSHGGGPEPY